MISQNDKLIRKYVDEDIINESFMQEQFIVFELLRPFDKIA